MGRSLCCPPPFFRARLINASSGSRVADKSPADLELAGAGRGLKFERVRHLKSPASPFGQTGNGAIGSREFASTNTISCLYPIARDLNGGSWTLVQRSAAGAARAKALFVLPDDPPSLHLGPRLADFAEQHALPLFGSYTLFATRALLSYGENLEATARESAAYIHKIVAGANPAELPIEQPTRFELSVNMKMAKQLGITIPVSVLVRADRIIE
jgi:hypothetical protein